MVERALELGLLALAALGVLRTLAMPAARRELHERPRLAVALAGAGVAVSGLATWAAVAAPTLLRALAAGVAIGWIALALRARDAYGRGRALPPGSLGLRPSLAAVADPDFYLHAFRRHGPVFKMAQIHRAVVCVLGIDAGRDLLRRHGSALRPAPLPLSAEIPRGFLRYMTPEDHARYARLFRSAVSEAALQAIAPLAAREMAEALAAIAADSRNGGPAGVDPAGADPAGVDPAPFVAASLHRVLLRFYFGGLLAPDDDAPIADCLRAADVGGAVGRPAPEAVRGLRRFTALLTERAARHDATADPSIWGELVRLDPETARDPTVLGNLFVLLAASEQSIGGLLRWTIVMLSRFPAWTARCRAGTAGDDPYTRAVHETLRLAQSEYVYREVTAPIMVGPHRVPKGWLLRICVAESHRQAPPFERPDDFDPDRHLARRYGANELSPFGLDLHACLGARMSLLFGRILAEELIRGFDCEVVSDGARTRANRHWHHWEPSPSFRLRLHPIRPGTA